ncbi:MAG TPA: discoidin domain-containing protein, partial [Nitrososphaeraceae archaeon]
FSGDSSGTTLNSQKYTIPATDARYVRITVNGNTANNWASITELDVFGSGSSPPPSCGTNLIISAVTASGNDGNVPSNVLDNNLNTRWSSNGIGQFIRADLGSIKNICSVDIAWYNGNARQYHFVIATSTDGTTFTNKFSGDSSGTTLNSQKYTIPATDARYVRITVNGNTANNWASITELDIFGSSSTSNVDKFGIKKLYPSKSGGEEWFMDMNNPLGDSRFNPQNTITKNPDGSWKMKSTQVRMNVYTSTGYDSDDIPTLDHSVIASKGYMLASNDWRNFEMTQYVKVNTSPSDDNFAPYGRGGRHTGSGAPSGCEGSSLKGDVFFSGKVRFAKEQWHVSYVFTNIKTATSTIEDKWVGIKFIVYNFVENSKVVVKTELWLDINNNGNFVKVDENVDRGGWGTEGTECGGAPDQIISWGGPITTFRWDTATDVDFKNLSVREILPPQ